MNNAKRLGEVKMGFSLRFLMVVAMCAMLAAVGYVVNAQPKPADAPAAGGAGPRPAWMPEVPKLGPVGRALVVNSPTKLVSAFESVRPGGVIAIADGTYKVPGRIFLSGKQNVTIRSISDDPTKCILVGALGWDAAGANKDKAEGDDIVIVESCSNITFSGITFSDCHSYGLKLENSGGPLTNITIRNCNFTNNGMRGIKGTMGDKGKMQHLKGGKVQYCTFWNTKIPAGGGIWNDGGNYITSIDLMLLDGWEITDNYFQDIKGKTGNARGAIFVWVDSKNVVAARNVIVGCDRGLTFGMTMGEKVHHTNAYVRNNYFVNCGDTAIEFARTNGIKIYNNTIFGSDKMWGIHYQDGITGVEVINNILMGRVDGQKDGVTEKNNATGAKNWFADPAKADMRLTGAARQAIGRAAAMKDFNDDIFGNIRPGRWDMGAYQTNGLKPGAKPTSSPTTSAPAE